MRFFKKCSPEFWNLVDETTEETHFIFIPTRRKIHHTNCYEWRWLESCKIIYYDTYEVFDDGTKKFFYHRGSYWGEN